MKRKRTNYTPEVEQEKMPIDWRKHLVSTPSIPRGKPRIEGASISVSLVLGYLAAGRATQEILAERPDLGKGQIAVYLDYAWTFAEFEVAV